MITASKYLMSVVNWNQLFFLLIGASPIFKYDTKDLFFFSLGCRREENSSNTHSYRPYQF